MKKEIQKFEKVLIQSYGNCIEYKKGCGCCEMWKEWNKFKKRWLEELE